MSSTYSPDLRLELIGTGDQAGVWGNTTNNNLGTFIENAVAGYTSVSIIASPQALTANDGAADEARFAAIALTTTTGANFTVCIPPCSKLYVFYNATAYTATISNSTAKNGIVLSGGTTQAIPAGAFMTLWSDGTNVNQQNTYFNSPVLGTPTLAGNTNAGTILSSSWVDTTTLTSAGFGVRVRRASGGGTAALQFTDNTGSTQLGLVGHNGTDMYLTPSTGSVSITNPSLTGTIALGTPTSATLTNATGLPIDGGTTGTLPVSRGGTGTTTSTGTGSVVLSASPTFTGTVNGNQAYFAGQVYGTSPNSGSSGGVQIRDASGDPDKVYLQAVSNSGGSQYGYIKFNSDGTFTFSGTIIGSTSTELGIGQSYSDVTGSRSWSTTYTNSTVKPIFVSVYGGGNAQMTAYVNGAIIQISKFTTTNTNTNVFFIVPPGATYSVTLSTGGSPILWTELR